MPYSSTSRLPASVRNTLPKGAQTIYRKAFENAWEEYKDADKRRGRASREEAAHKVAWSAVKTKYKKNGEGKWSTRGAGISGKTARSATAKSSAGTSRAKSATGETKRKSPRKSAAATQTKSAARTKSAAGGGQQARWKTASTRGTKTTTRGARAKTAARRGKDAAAGAGQKPRKSRKPAAETAAQRRRRQSAETANPAQAQPGHVMSQELPERAPAEHADAVQVS